VTTPYQKRPSAAGSLLRTALKRSAGMCNHPSRGYPASMKLLEKFKDISPLRYFVTHRFKVEDAAAAMAQVQDLNACIANACIAQELRNTTSDLTLGKPVSVIRRRRQSVVKLYQLQMLNSNLAVLPIQHRHCPRH
jgi:hypothetical protein